MRPFREEQPIKEKGRQEVQLTEGHRVRDHFKIKQETRNQSVVPQITASTMKTMRTSLKLKLNTRTSMETGLLY